MALRRRGALMATKALCVVCRERPAEVRDRESMSPRKKVCGPCHAKRLLGDLDRIKAYHDHRDKMEERIDGKADPR